MTKFIWMSDLHFVAEGRVQNYDPCARLRAAVRHVNDRHQDAQFCILSGDLVDRGTAADYAALHEVLVRLKLPFYPMVGNHDDRELLRRHLPVPDTSLPGFIQYAVETNDAVLLCLDTLDSAGSDAGSFCASRLGWLSEKLGQYADRPSLLFMHHHPAPLGLPMQDRDRLQAGSEFFALIKEHANVCHLCIGHVHRPMTGVISGVPFTTMRSILYQAPPPSPSWNWESFVPASEAPNLGVVHVSDRGLTIQFEQFCAYDFGLAR